MMGESEEGVVLPCRDAHRYGPAPFAGFLTRWGQHVAHVQGIGVHRETEFSETHATDSSRYGFGVAEKLGGRLGKTPRALVDQYSGRC